jgi:hypothetical protein
MTRASSPGAPAPASKTTPASTTTPAPTPAPRPAGFTSAWDEVKPSLQTGDVILQHGVYPSSLMIEGLEQSEWSHIGMVVLATDIGLDPKKVPALLYWESNDLTNLPDVVTGKIKPAGGPMLVDLELRLSTNAAQTIDMAFNLRQLNTVRTPAMLKALAAFIAKMQPNVGFPTSEQAILEFIMGRYENVVPDIMNHCFCSQLVAASYQEMGLLTKQQDAVGYSPRDFSEAGSISLLNRAFLIGDADNTFFPPPLVPTKLTKSSKK